MSSVLENLVNNLGPKYTWTTREAEEYGGGAQVTRVVELEAPIWDAAEYLFFGSGYVNERWQEVKANLRNSGVDVTWSEAISIVICARWWSNKGVIDQGVVHFVWTQILVSGGIVVQKALLTQYMRDAS